MTTKKSNSNSNGDSKTQTANAAGALHYEMDGEAVHRYGQDDACVGGWGVRR